MRPGPSEVDPRLVTVLAEPILPHYGAEWGKVYAEALEVVKRIPEQPSTQ